MATTLNNGRGRTKVLNAPAEPGPLTQRNAKDAVSKALKAIDPEAAAKAGVK
jgi:hypothetical protein